MRALVRRFIERSLVRTRVDRFRRRGFRGRTLVLAYHNIVPEGERPCGERTIHLPQREFAAQLDLLREVTEVVPLQEALLGQEALRPRVAISWDDAYRGALTAGLEETVRRGIPVTLFVAPGRLGDQIFWWDRLAELHGGELPQALRVRALNECAGREEFILKALRPAEVTLPGHARTVTEPELLAAAARQGVTLASHGWEHGNLSRLEPDALREEIERSRVWLSRVERADLTSIAYPYGLESPSVRRMAKQAGYLTGWRVSGGWLPARAEDHLALPRLNVPAGVSLEGFALRLAGLFCG